MDSERKKEQERHFTKNAHEIKTKEKVVEEINKLRKKRGLSKIRGRGKEIKEKHPVPLKNVKLMSKGHYPFDLSDSKRTHSISAN